MPNGGRGFPTPLSMPRSCRIIPFILSNERCQEREATMTNDDDFTKVVSETRSEIAAVRGKILRWLLEFDRVASDESIRPREKLLILKSIDDKYWGSPT